MTRLLMTRKVLCGKMPKVRPKPRVKVVGTVDLVIEATDLVGNKTTMTLEDVHHDEVVPTITDFFPNNELLAGDDNQINDATRHPVFTLKEATDSIAIVYDPSGGDDIVHVVADGLPKGEQAGGHCRCVRGWQDLYADDFCSRSCGECLRDGCRRCC